MTTAPEALAMRTSFFVTSPTSAETISSCTFVLLIPSRICRTASAEPKTSALMMSLSTRCWVAAMLAKSCSTDTSRGASTAPDFFRRWPSSSARFSASRADFTAWKIAPLSGVPDQPMTRAGVPGGASLTGLPWSLKSARTLAHWAPHTRASPTRRVPRCTMTVASGPRPTSTWDSTIVPLASALGLALSSRTSVWSKITSRSSLTPVPLTAETGTVIVSPPQSSGAIWRCCIWPLTMSRLAPLTSILFTATSRVTLALRMCWRASSVCGMKPSSAATTRTAMSVTKAPRARILLKAAWPGVSRKVIFRPLNSIW